MTPPSPAPRAQTGLERSCNEGFDAGDRIACAAPAPGIERIAATFRRRAFAPHRHDTYAIGTTVQGVQTFGYRGAARHSLPGQVFILHPDERHDGRAGTDAGYGYRIAYIDPTLIGTALAGRALPFVPTPVSTDHELRVTVWALLSEYESPPEALRMTGLIAALADTLERMAGGSLQAGPLDRPAVTRARDLLATNPNRRIDNELLEAASGLDRWTLARQFRHAFGVSPHRFLVLRRLDRARDLVQRGIPLAEAAHDAGFADQSHMTRHFRGAYGLSPGQWRDLTKQAKTLQ